MIRQLWHLAALLLAPIIGLTISEAVHGCSTNEKVFLCENGPL